MKNIENMFTESKDFVEYSGKYFGHLAEMMKSLDTGAVSRFVSLIENAYKNGNTVFISGNGGSAATASHMANDLSVGVPKKSGCSGAIKALSLNDNIPVMTAIANDGSYDDIFVDQLRVHFRDGDKFIAISASGNSPNLVKAAKWVKDKGGSVTGILGFDGGDLKAICDTVIHVRSEKGEYGPVEDIHMVLDHLVATWLQQRMKSEKGDFTKNGR